MKNLSVWIIWPLFLGSLICATSARAQVNQYWDPTFTGGTGGGGAGTWNSANTNWYNGTSDATWISGNIAVFGGAGGTVILGASETVGGLTFNTSGYTIANSGSSSLTLTGTPTISVASGTATIIRAIAGSGIPLTVGGSGTLVLGATNTFSGGTTINAGSALTLTGASGASGGTGTITNNGILTINSTNSSTVTIANGVTGTGTVNFNQNANYLLTGSWANFSGTINLVAGGSAGDEMIVESQPPLSVTETWNVETGQTLAIAGFAVSNASTIILNGPGNTGKYGAIRIDNGTNWGPVLLNGTNNWIGSDGGTFTITGVISDTNSGSGIVITSGQANNRDFIVFAAPNTYTGLTTLSNGTLRAGYAENPGTNGPFGTSTIQFAGTIGAGNVGTLQYSVSNTYDYSGRFSAAANQPYVIDVNGQAVSFASPLTSSGGTLVLRDTAGLGTLTLNAANTYTAGTIVSNNSTTLVANVAGAIPGNVTLNGGTLVGNVSGALAANVTLNGASAVLTLSNASAMSQYATLTLPASPTAGSVNLDFTGTQTVSALDFGASPQALGTYGAVGTTATFQSSTFTGTGILNVAVPVLANAYWDANGTDASSQSSANGGGTGTWNSGNANWWVSGSSDTTWLAYAANFAGTAGTVTLSANESAEGLAFTTSGYLITNSSGAVLTLSGVPTASVASGTATVGCPISVGVGGLTTSGSGTLVLSANDTISGPLTVSNALMISGSGELGGGNYLGNITVPGSFIYSSSSAQTLAGAISDAGTGLGTLSQQGSGTLTLSGANTYGGGTTIATNSTLVLTSASGAGAGTGLITNNGILTVNPSSSSTVTFANSIVGGSNSVINFDQNANISLTGSYADFSGTINLVPNGANANEVLANTATPFASVTNETINIETGQTLAISVPGGVTFQGTVILHGAGNGVGFGALRFDNGTQAGPVFLAGTNNWIGSDSGTVTFSGPISDTNGGNGIIVTARPTTTRDYLIFAGINTYTGLTTINNGTLQLGIGENPGTNGPLGTSSIFIPNTFGQGGNIGVLQYSAVNQYDYSGRFSAAANQAYAIDVNGQAVTFASPLTSAGGMLVLLDAAGGGTLTLNATNTLSGGTILSNGTLIGAVTGSVPGPVSLNGGTLVGGAAGSITGNVTAGANGALVLSNASAMSTNATLTLPATPYSGQVSLNFSGTQYINTLYLDTNQQPAGLYGASTNNPNGVFIGTGNLFVGILPPITISTPTITSNQLTISWTSVAGSSYNVYATTNLQPPITWTNVNSSPIVASGSNTSYTVPGTVSGQLYLKIQQ